MSDPKRGSLITVGAPKSAKNKVTKTVRLTINLDESNESKYPELNYKELVSAEEKKKKVVNGKAPGLDPFSDNDDDVERVARKFEQKYGGKSTYGKKGSDEFADIGAGYDENDSFIDNTHGYDEMIPPEYDTIYGGFYINCGSLEFKAVAEGQSPSSDVEPGGGRRNKRRISSSSSEEESSESSSESESQDEKETKTINGAVDSHDTEHRKKKNKNTDKKKAKKIRRTDSSAPTSGKQTSDDNAHGDADSADSRTSQSDSLTSKPAPSSENAVTSDSSRDVEATEVKLPEPITRILEELQANFKRRTENNSKGVSSVDPTNEQIIVKLNAALSEGRTASRVRRAAWERAAKLLNTSRAKLLRSLRLTANQTLPTQQNAQPNQVTAITKPVNNKRKAEEEKLDVNSLSAAERELRIVETLERLKALIEERKPSMLANYQAECERVQEEKKKIQIACASEGAPHIEKRLPKRRFPWCPLSRQLVTQVKLLANSPQDAANLLAKRVLPLFPNGFVRMPALLRQADLNKEIKESAAKRPRLNSQSQPPAQPTFTEPIHFPSSLTVTPSLKHSPEKTDTSDRKATSVFSSIINSFTMSKDLVIEKPEKERRREDKPKEDLYIPRNNIGSITITAVSNPPKAEKKSNVSAIVNADKKEGLIRIKSPAALNSMVRKEIDKLKKPEKNSVKDKRLEMPLQIDTNYQMNKKLPSPNLKKLPSPSVNKDEITKKQIESMRVVENNIPRPALVPVHHSPTFAKPDKRPPEVKKKKDLVIVSDVDPLSDNQEPVNVDDSSSDVEVIEDKTDKSEHNSEVPSNSVVREPSERDKSVSDMSEECVNRERPQDGHKTEEEATNDDFEMVMRNIKEMSNSQETSKLTNSFEGVIKNAKRETKQTYGVRDMYPDSDDNKFAERTSLNKMDGFSPVTG